MTLSAMRHLRARGPHRGAAAGMILCYHRVARADRDPWLMCVSPEHFGEHLDVIKAHSEPLRLPELAAATLDGRRRTRQLLAVTFDDGYADNLYHAKPLLEAADVPATVFVVSGAVGSSSEFWWDALERVVLGEGVLPETLELRLRETSFALPLAELGFDDAESARHDGWNAVAGDDPTPRHRLFRSLHAALRTAPASERAAAISALLAGRNPRARESHRPLSQPELRSLVEGDLIDVGAHTVTHSVLSGLAQPEQRREIEQSKSQLEGILDRPVRAFSYPYGQFEHYTAASVRLVREAGYDLACSNVAGVVRRRGSAFELPRFTVPDWDGERLSRTLETWLAG